MKENISNQPFNSLNTNTAINKDFKIKMQLEYILKNYLPSRKEIFAAHNMGNHIRNEITKTLEEELSLDKKYYQTKGSIGQSKWAEIPWISIFIKNITTGASQGYYIVFLFKADMTGFYISLNQGWTYFKDKYGKKEGYKKIKRTATLVREQLNTIPDHLNINKIDLASTEKLATGYTNGHICGRYYSLESLPSSREIINDVYSLITTYQEINKLMNGRSTAQFNDYLLLSDDDEFLEEDEQEVKYQETVNDLSTTDSVHNDHTYTEEPEERQDPKIDKGGRKKWPRDAKIAAVALKLSGYKCSYNENHETFISKVTGKPFMELHHLVPMSSQEKFLNNLDRVANVKSLCPLCHRAIHHGEDKIKSTMIEQLYEEYRNGLEAVGVDITLNDLKKAYDIN